MNALTEANLDRARRQRHLIIDALGGAERAVEETSPRPHATRRDRLAEAHARLLAVIGSGMVGRPVMSALEWADGRATVKAVVDKRSSARTAQRSADLRARHAPPTPEYDPRTSPDSPLNRWKSAGGDGTPSPAAQLGLGRRGGGRGPARDDPDAFTDYLRTGQMSDGMRAQGEGVGSEGGYLVPEGFRQKLVQRMRIFGGLARVAEEIVTKTGNNLPWISTDDTANEGEIVAENGGFSLGADMVFGQRNLTAFRYAAGGGAQQPIRLPVELIQDAAIDVEALAARVLGERLGRVQARHLVRGTGAGEPEGLLRDAVGTPIAGTRPSHEELVDATHALDPAYREPGRCRWLMNDRSLREVKKIKNADGDAIWKTSMRWGLLEDLGRDPTPAELRAAQQVELLGYPVTVDQAMPDIVDDDTVWAAFGDFRAAYVVRRVREVWVVVNPWNRASNGQVEVSAFSRMDGAIQDPYAFACVAGPA